MELTNNDKLNLALEIMSDEDVENYEIDAETTETDNERLDIALEIMSDDDVDKYAAVAKIAEEENMDIYNALTKYEETKYEE